jgi:hypothetical protein
MENDLDTLIITENNNQKMENDLDTLIITGTVDDKKAEHAAEETEGLTRSVSVKKKCYLLVDVVHSLIITQRYSMYSHIDGS